MFGETWLEGLKGSFKKQRLPSYVQSRLDNNFRRDVHNLCLKVITERYYWDSDLAISVVTTLLVNL